MESVGADAFRGDQLLRKGTWIVAFLADWCPFCRRFRPQFSTLEGAAAFRVAVGDVSSEESPLWDVFRIEVVPTIVVFRDGRPVFRVDGILGEGLSEANLHEARSAAMVGMK